MLERLLHGGETFSKSGTWCRRQVEQRTDAARGPSEMGGPMKLAGAEVLWNTQPALCEYYSGRASTPDLPDRLQRDMAPFPTDALAIVFGSDRQDYFSIAPNAIDDYD
ncbi:hypothetical protein VC83_05064 [Pseudogymnoascus destructans]|uniref:Uncharacterized protein n=1 Tax=Pseudogymnoascus destructans TaxID=655981 RepID=A0A177ABS6_9PEZI|nr:uncharacterized protein VC83_05064 [Pseudogymnoascus destructans]OAF58634.1 hypothetical protein VC83_05064 [Pseudogymnoascus destructans]